MTDNVIKDLEAAVRTKEALHETFINNIEARLKQHRDRIEKLERALGKIAVHHRYNEEMASIARKALEGKDG